MQIHRQFLETENFMYYHRQCRGCGGLAQLRSIAVWDRKGLWYGDHAFGDQGVDRVSTGWGHSLWPSAVSAVLVYKKLEKRLNLAVPWKEIFPVQTPKENKKRDSVFDYLVVSHRSRWDPYRRSESSGLQRYRARRGLFWCRNLLSDARCALEGTVHTSLCHSQWCAIYSANETKRCRKVVFWSGGE